MKRHAELQRLPFVTATIVFVFSFAACASNSPSHSADVIPLAPPSLGGAHGWPAYGKLKKPILFVAYSDNVVRMYDPNVRNPSVEGEISDGVADPHGLAVDSKGWLYVANDSSRASGITVYSPGRNKPRYTIPAPGFYGLAINSKDDIFCTDPDGFVSAYKPGAKKPYETFNSFANPRGVAVDSKDNIWVADISFSKVYEIPAGTKKVEDTGLDDIQIPNGLAFGPGDVLYVANLGAYSRNPYVSVYHPGSKRPAYVIKEHRILDLNGVTASGLFFQSSTKPAVLGYRPNKKHPFSTISGTAYPRGVASTR